ncbi:hypothetical protein Ade02nite_17550 [Paractinoplanes deccanensis]|uniref:Uncharacterized protein n=1 Tax=Paractinoplanes deccanensis TaxID=113561 RepID=A0ABQ3XZD3_9ACTN|nr:hypothetical protein [Actinoplanes deccanensis]GID73114.1 hypothetical protein Ade02nite_17550 [Actinoplanes deccanensis]
MSEADGRGVKKTSKTEELVIRGAIEIHAQTLGGLTAMATGPAAPITHPTATRLARQLLKDARARERAEEEAMSWDEFHDKQDKERKLGMLGC